MLTIIRDSREVLPLVFPEMVGSEVVVECLFSGDYGCRIDGEWIKTLFERKEKGDLFNSYSSGYEREKDKFLRAQVQGYKFILAIEEPFTEILKGHTYKKDGTYHESKKSGISMIRQLMSIQVRYGIDVKFFQSRREMALYIQEYFLAYTRLKPVAQSPPTVA